MNIILVPHEIGLITEEYNGQGGWQNLLDKLNSQLNGNYLYLTNDDIAKVENYTAGQGGFQKRFERLLEIINRNR